MVLDEMQMLDQQVAAPRAIDQQVADFFKRVQIDLAPLWRAGGFAAPLAAGVRSSGDLFFLYRHIASGYEKTFLNQSKQGPSTNRLIDNFYRSG
jgi:hypothetical protein